MMIRMKLGIFLLITLRCATAAGCLPIVSDRILGRDLALADPRFSALPSTLVLGWTPAPGAKRTFTSDELSRVLKANHLEAGSPEELCFEVPVHDLDATEALARMRQALPNADVKIVELSKTPVPPGTLEFPLSALEAAAGGHAETRLWRGFVRYSETKRAPVWARVTISQTVMAVVAARDLPANTAIEATALRLEKRTVSVQGLAGRLEEVAGFIPRRAIRSGEPVPLSLLEKAPDVRRGELVTVEVRSGSALLRLSAVAERDAHSGQILELRNPSNGKTFQARLDGPRAVIRVGGGL